MEETIFGMTKHEIADLAEKLDRAEKVIPEFRPKTSGNDTGYSKFLETMRRGHAAMMKNWLNARGTK